MDRGVLVNSGRMPARLTESHPKLKTFGTFCCGWEPTLLVWKSLRQVFRISLNPAVWDKETNGCPTFQGPRCKVTLLQQYSVDLLVVDMGGQRSEPRDPEGPWYHWIVACPLAQRPIWVFESWEESSLLWSGGPASKSATVKWGKLGYETRCRALSAIDLNGSIDQRKLLVIRTRKDCGRWEWVPVSSTSTPRSMRNLLVPDGLVRRQLWKAAPPPNTRIRSCDDPMPSSWNGWVRTPKGTRRILPEELCKGLGAPMPAHFAYRDFVRTTSIFHWEYLSRCLMGASPEVRAEAATDYPTAEPPPTDPIPPASFSWVPPEVGPGTDFYRSRMDSLISASKGYPNSVSIVEEGIQSLNRHQRNYINQEMHISCLQILWWEFQPIHWEALRQGSRMNFLRLPTAGLHPNSEMDEEQKIVAGKFVDELVELGAVGLPPTGRQVLTVAPLFCVPKPGQPGEWRVIADMKQGGQNLVVGPDPVILPRSGHMLEEMYSGGYTAVVDASKFFYQFLTHPLDRPYLGLRHPLTDQLFEYVGLPMGSSNSPALAGRYGLAFVRLLKEEHPELFQGVPYCNCWWSSFTDPLSYKPHWGHGLVRVRTNGQPVVKIWVHVDDFAIHGPDYDSTASGLKAFMNLAIKVGLLCNPAKCEPPRQVAKYCGFIFDTIGTPTLRIPPAKRDRGRSMIAFCLAKGPHHEHSRWALAVIVGTLEALSEATPQRMGHTRLREFHNVLRPPGLGSGLAPYCTTTTLPPSVLQDLTWWLEFLQMEDGRQVRPTRAHYLVPLWGDGSGTGTGGTIDIPTLGLEMWMGQWCPEILHFSSNWKELKTLELALLRLMPTPHQSTVQGAQLFYFTDNSTTYWIGQSGSSRSPELHKLIEHIRRLELRLRCHLHIVHVPGTVMITQGTDGLSRGLWMTALNKGSHLTPAEMNSAVFAPLEPDTHLIQRTVDRYHLSRIWEIYDWNGPWKGSNLFQRMTVWFPPPELARQCLLFILETWVESPYDMSALLFIPRTLAGSWHGLSRHVIELEQFLPQDEPLAAPPALPIPIVILYLPPFVPSLDRPPDLSRSLDSPPPSRQHWHRQQAEQMRRLSFGSDLT